MFERMQKGRAVETAQRKKKQPHTGKENGFANRWRTDRYYYATGEETANVIQRAGDGNGENEVATKMEEAISKSVTVGKQKLTISQNCYNHHFALNKTAAEQITKDRRKAESIQKNTVLPMPQLEAFSHDALILPFEKGIKESLSTSGKYRFWQFEYDRINPETLKDYYLEDKVMVGVIWDEHHHKTINHISGPATLQSPYVGRPALPEYKEDLESTIPSFCKALEPIFQIVKMGWLHESEIRCTVVSQLLSFWGKTYLHTYTELSYSRMLGEQMKDLMAQLNVEINRFKEDYAAKEEEAASARETADAAWDAYEKKKITIEKAEEEEDTAAEKETEANKMASTLKKMEAARAKSMALLQAPEITNFFNARGLTDLHQSILAPAPPAVPPAAEEVTAGGRKG